MSATPAQLPELPPLVQYGLLGIALLAFIARKGIVPEWTLRKAEENHAAEKAELLRQNEELNNQVRQLQDVFQKQVIPALTQATAVNAKYTEELQYARFKKQQSTQSQGET